ncbi:MAG: phytanoyl-CoA dioxygenase family protein [Acidimicrobiales bacterium]
MAGEHLLSTAEVAALVARGFLIFESVVPPEINTAALELFEQTAPIDLMRDKPTSGTPLSELYPEPSPIGAMLRLPRVQGIITSLVGPEPVYDHDWVHVREPGDVLDQHLHQDAIIDTTLAFDIQLFWFPHDVAAGEGGTGFVPGSHLRAVNEADIGRYQNLVGQRDITGPAGSLAVFHQGLWHRGRANHGAQRRFMYKVRLNPTGPQVRCWDLADYDEVHGDRSDHIFASYQDHTAAAMFRRAEPWHEAATGRLETVNRSRLWRYLTADTSFDADWYLTRTEGRERIDRGTD